MPTKIEYWRCDICNQSHDDVDAAVVCETRGAEPPSFSVGLICVDDHNYLGHGDMAILQVLAQPFKRMEYSHTCAAGWWTFRDHMNGAPHSVGDSVGDEMSSGPEIIPSSPSKLICDPDRGTPRYHRAWSWAKDNGITLTVIAVDGVITRAGEPL